MLIGPIRAVVFDLDGTLIDSSAGVVDAVNYALRQTGHATRPASAITPYIGYPLKQMFADFGVGPLDELYRHFQIRAADTVVSSSTLLSGARETVELLTRRGIRLAIATTKVKRHVDGIVARFGWRDYISVTVAGDEVTQVKPHPEPFRLALERLGVASKEAVAVGDTVNDILAAQAVPMRVVAVASPYGGADRVRRLAPDHFIEHIDHLPGLLASN